MEIRSTEVKGGLALFLVLLILSYILYNVYQNKDGSITTYLLTFFIWSLTFMMLYGDWLPFKRGIQINTLSGISGTQIGQPVHEHSGLETRYICFERRMIHKDIKKQVEGTWSWIRDILSGTITIPLTSKRSLWDQVPDYDCENPNGCILFRGRIDGGTLRNPDIIVGLKQIERQSQIISYSQTALTKLEEQIANIANQKIYDSEKMSQHLKTIADNVKNVQVIAKGGSAGVEAAASEISA
ncbi:hypothetical protein ACFL43_04135 [Thermodesulfobacteriota bacterium]